MAIGPDFFLKAPKRGGLGPSVPALAPSVYTFLGLIRWPVNLSKSGLTHIFSLLVHHFLCFGPTQEVFFPFFHWFDPCVRRASVGPRGLNEPGPALPSLMPALGREAGFLVPLCYILELHISIPYILGPLYWAGWNVLKTTTVFLQHWYKLHESCPAISVSNLVHASTNRKKRWVLLWIEFEFLDLT